MIIVDVPKLKGHYDPYNASIRIMTTPPCQGQKYDWYDIKLVPRMVIKQISGEAFFEISKGEDIDNSKDYKKFLKISHDPGCAGDGLVGSGDDFSDFFYRKDKLPPQFTLQKAAINQVRKKGDMSKVVKEMVNIS